MISLTRWINHNAIWALIIFILLTTAWMIGSMAIMNMPLVALFILLIYAIAVPMIAKQIKKVGTPYETTVDSLVKDVLTIAGYMLLLLAFAYFFPETWDVWHFSVSYWITLGLIFILIVMYSHLKYKWLRFALIAITAVIMISGIMIEYKKAAVAKKEKEKIESAEKQKESLENREKEVEIGTKEQDLKDRQEAPLNKRLKEVLEYYNRKAECFGIKTYKISKDTVRVFLPRYSKIDITITEPYGASIEIMDANGHRYSYKGHRGTPLNGGDPEDLQPGDYLRLYCPDKVTVTADIEIDKKSDNDIKIALAAGK